MIETIEVLPKTDNKNIKMVGANVESTKIPTKSTKSTSIQREQLQKGNLALKHIVSGLCSLGMSTIKVYDTLLHYNNIYNICTINLTKEDLFQVIHEVKNTKNNGISTYDEIMNYIETTDGEFTLKDVCEMTNVENNKKGKNKASSVLSRLVKECVIERVGKKNGHFRKIDTELDEIDWMNAEDYSVDMWLPFGLHDMVKIHYGNIILIAGEPNSGKTALCFNIIRYNMEKFKTHYFNSEMGASEMKDRIKNFNDIVPSDWDFKAYERAGNFEDVITKERSEKGNLLVFDFLEIHNEFYMIGGMLKKIHEKLGDAIAVICLQKDIGKDMGRGGLATLEKPRLNLALAPGFVKIVKAKTPKVKGDNHNNKIKKWTCRDGCWFTDESDWFIKGGKSNG